MYSTCLFCHQSLGANQSIEHFPVGARLAYDAAKGRLWVVCKECGRWNLSPLEERWEAIEEAERVYRDTKKRVATDNVGLARLRDGTDLIRIGAPLLPEFAAWRYGDTFARRRGRAMKTLALVSATSAFASRFGTGALGLAFGGSILLQAGLGVAVGVAQALRVRVQIYDQHGSRRMLSQGEAWTAKYGLDRGTGELTIEVASRNGTDFGSTAAGIFERVKSVSRFAYDERFAIRLSGGAARSALFNLMPIANINGGDERQVADATQLVTDLNTPAKLLWRLPASDQQGFWRSTGGKGTLINLQPAFRLALEMSLHEESERRAMDGELAALEARWKEAEEIAAIADNLTLSPTRETRIREMRNDAGRAEE